MSILVAHNDLGHCDSACSVHKDYCVWACNSALCV